VSTISALNVEAGGLGAEGAGTDDDTGDADEMGDIRCGQAADGSVRDGGVDEELVLGQCSGEVEVVFASRGVEDLLRTRLECCFELVEVSATK